MGHVLAALVWAIVGAAIGAGMRRGTVWLTHAEGLEPGFKGWQVYGPPILNAALFALFGGVMGFQWVLLIRTLWVAVLVQVIFFDLEHHLILDRVMFPAMAAAIVLSLLTPGLGIKQSVLTGIAAGVVFLLIALLGAVIFRAEALGFGDVKLAAFIGLIVGWPFAGQALLYGVLLAGVISILLIVFRIRSMKDSIAYGPFMAAGALIVLFSLSTGAAQ
jgi:prepilin signal peptidase PulO-like enzyme (type II secretory pathway)